MSDKDAEPKNSYAVIEDLEEHSISVLHTSYTLCVIQRPSRLETKLNTYGARRNTLVFFGSLLVSAQFLK